MKMPSIKTQLIIFLAAFALFLSVKEDDPLFILTTFIAVLSAAAFDALFSYYRNRVFRITASSLITGLIIGFVLAGSERWWIFSLAALGAILSKHLIRINRKHLFNPASFGIVSVILLLGAETQWKGTYAWYILFPAGIYIVYKIRKMSLLLSYGLTALCLFGIQAAVQKAPFINIFGYLSYFYIFVMLIEPKTTPAGNPGKIIFGASCAILIFLLTEAGIRLDAELVSLLTLNLAVPLLDRLAGRRKICVKS